ARIEAALLTGDGIDDPPLNLRPDRAIIRDPEGRECEVLEWKPAPERCLTEQHYGACVFVTGGNFADRCEHRHIRGPFSKLGEAAGDEVVLANGVEDLNRAHDVHSGRGGVGRRPYHNILEPEPRPCELAVIGGRVASRRLVMRTSVVGLAERLRRAALPIGGACAGDRVAGAWSDF